MSYDQGKAAAKAPKSTNDLVETLEGMVDGSSLAHVLDALGEVCDAKADHLGHSWQDHPSAKRWRAAAKVMERAYSNAAVTTVSGPM